MSDSAAVAAPNTTVVTPSTPFSDSPQRGGPPDLETFKSVFSDALDKLEPKKNKFIPLEQPKEPAVEAPVKKDEPKQKAEPKVEPKKEPEVKSGGNEEPPPSEPEFSSEKEKIRWGELKKAEKELLSLKPYITELETKIKEKDGSLAELEQYRSEVKALKEQQEAVEGELYLSRVQATRKYRELIAEPLLAIESGVKQFAENNSLDADQIMNILVRGDENALDEFVADLNPRKQAKVQTWFEDVQRLHARKQEIEAHSKQAYEAAMEEERTRHEQQTQAFLEKRSLAIKNVSEKFGENIFKVLPDDKRPDIDAIRAEVAKYHEWPEELRVYSAFAGAALPDVVEQYKASQAQVKQLKAELSKLRNGSPKVAGGSPTTSSPDKVDYSKVKEKDFIADMASRFPGRR